MANIITINSADAMRSYGGTIAQQLTSGDIVAIKGPLGAGKTTLVQGIVSQFDVEEEVTSPTFSIINYYQRSKIYHLDLYRIHTMEQLILSGALEIIDDNRCIVCIEWFDKFVDCVIPTFVINIELQDTMSRSISCTRTKTHR